MRAMHPDWLGSPQHVAAGAVLALLLTEAGVRTTDVAVSRIAFIALGVTMGAEALVELVEYPLLYSDHYHPTAYYDTVADIASSLVGAAVAISIWLVARRPRAREA
jgi:hypothetical protein